MSVLKYVIEFINEAICDNDFADMIVSSKHWLYTLSMSKVDIKNGRG